MSVVNLDLIARVAHEANRAFCVSIGDDSQQPWESAPEWQKESAVNGVSFHLKQLDAGREPSPAESHEKWMQDKLADGWKWGPRKDPEKKEHPCVKPYHELPREQRSKDFIFAAIAKAFFDGDVDIARVTKHAKVA